MFTLEQRNDLVVSHIPLANMIAARYFQKTPPQVTLDELRSAAYMGLVGASRRYEGGPFPLFATYRIYGEIKDYLRSLAWGNRTHPVRVAALAGQDRAEEEDGGFEEFFEDLTKAVGEDRRKILRLRYAQDMKIRQIAKVVGSSPTRVHQVLQECLAGFRQHLTSAA